MEKIDGCYHSMLKYMSDLSGISYMKKLSFKSVEESGLSYANHFILNGEDLGALTKIYRKGGILVLTDQFSKSLNIPINTEFDEIFRLVPRKIEEFGIPFQKVGNYTDSLGGGWTCKVPRYRVKDKFFAEIECTCF